MLFRSDIRRIVRSNKLAIVLGIELDNFGDFNDPTKVVNESAVREEIRRLYYDRGVRYIFPIHFADNKFGGCALYGRSNITNLASHFTKTFIDFAVTPPEAIATLPGFKYSVEKAPDSRITYRLKPFLENTEIIGLRHAIELIESHPSPCAGAFADPIRGPICAAAGINMACPDLRCALLSKGDYRIIKSFMLSPSIEYEIYNRTEGGHRNANGISLLGQYALKEMMRLGMMIDIDHMSEKTIDTVIRIARDNDYPINSGHTGFRGNGGNSENTRTDEQLAAINARGGMMGVGIAKNIAPSFLAGFRYADTLVRRLSFGSDINGMEVMPFGRFRADGTLIQDNNIFNYRNYSSDIQSRALNKVRYISNTIESGTFNSIPISMCTTAGKTWDYNVDGVAHIGLYPDYWQDLKNLGMTVQERSKLFMGAENFAQMWEKCERQRNNIR